MQSRPGTPYICQFPPFGGVRARSPQPAHGAWADRALEQMGGITGGYHGRATGMPGMRSLMWRALPVPAAAALACACTTAALDGQREAAVQGDAVQGTLWVRCGACAAPDPPGPAAPPRPAPQSVPRPVPRPRPVHLPAAEVFATARRPVGEGSGVPGPAHPQTL